MRVLVCGSRNWNDYVPIFDRVAKLPKDATIIEGGASGADEWASVAARKYKLKHERFPANWKEYGRSAGPIRNQQMLESGIDLVLAFRKNNSRGTTDMIDRAAKASVPIEIVDIPYEATLTS